MLIQKNTYIKTRPRQQTFMSARRSYIKVMETRPLRVITEHPIALTAVAWNLGNLVRILVTAYNTNTTGNNSVSLDNKFTVIARTSSDAVSNMLSYWIPFFAVNPFTKRITRKLLGARTPARVFNFTSELMALVPTMLIFHGLGAKLSSYLTNLAINNKDSLKNYAVVNYLMNLGREAPDTQHV